MKIEMAASDDGKFYENANFETGENCVLISRAESSRRAEYAMMREALEAVEKFIEQKIHPSGAIDAAETRAVFGPKFLIHAGSVLDKVRAALGREE